MLGRLSAECEVVIGEVEEHVMYSMAQGWKHGQKSWVVIHDAQKDRDHLEVQGELPVMFGAIRDQLRSEQQAAGGKKTDVDYIFDIPGKLA